MKEIFGDIWQLSKDNDADAIVITTNGVVKKNGEAVMGRGVALEAAQRHPDFPLRLGYRLKEWGNIPFIFEFGISSFTEGTVDEVFFSMPVKHNWWEKADLNLIAASAQGLFELADTYGFKKILVPRPGCGNGGLKWKDVKPVIEPYLDDRFIIVSKEKE